MNLCLSLKATKALAAPNSPVLKYSAPVSTDCLFWLFNIPSLVFSCWYYCVLSQMLSLGIYRILLGSGQLWSTSKLRRIESRLNTGIFSRMVYTIEWWMSEVKENIIIAASTCSHRKLTMRQKWSNVFLQGWSQLHCRVWYRSDGCALSMALE